MTTDRISILRYWAAGMVSIILALIVSAPLTFLASFFEFLREEYGIASVGIIYTLLYIALVPYVLGRIIEWIARKILLLEA